MPSNQLIKKYLASCLLEAIENENISEVEELMKRNASPNLMIINKGYAAIHYCAGMENTEFSEKAMDILLKNHGDPNIQTVLEQLTPLHIACMGGHSNIVLKLMKHGGDINIIDEDKLTPIQYAIDESHYDTIKIIKNFIFEQKMEKKQSSLIKASQTKSKSNYLLVPNLEESQYTPNRRNYNFDITSPYYINITHRQRDKYNNPSIPAKEVDSPITPTTKALMESTRISMVASNLFDLTENNLMEFTRVHNPNRNRDSLIDIWRNKVKHPTRTAILQVHNDINELLSEFEVADDENSKSASDTSFTEATVENRLPSPVPTSSELLNETFHTACNSANKKIQETKEDFIKSPSGADIIMQVAENYLHTDNETGMIFYEKKIFPSNLSKRNLDPNGSCSSLSTSFTVPSDYGTDQLRTELATFGHIPGPITKSTKRLYLKRLIKFKRTKDKMSMKIPVIANDITQNFSIELRKTLKNDEWFGTIDKHLDLEKIMIESIKILPHRALREGHLKTSFVYLLIDPRISDNLPGQYKFLAKSKTWEKFLKSIFYVGKGKSSRPYSHLYEAIQYYNGLMDAEEKENCAIRELRNLALNDGSNEIIFIDRNAPCYNKYLQVSRQNNSSIKMGGNRKQIELTKKLDRIVNIWQSNSGVVCLHLFHNISPTEAYTREASIIDCLTLNHLTNKKSGDYYGITKTWTMRTKKHLGIGLLYRAMQTYLAQGESQLMPRDLL